MKKRISTVYLLYLLSIYGSSALEIDITRTWDLIGSACRMNL